MLSLLRKIPSELMVATSARPVPSVSSVPSALGFRSSNVISLQAGRTRSFVGGYVPRGEEIAFSEYYENEEGETGIGQSNIANGSNKRHQYWWQNQKENSPNGGMILGLCSVSKMLLFTAKFFELNLLKSNDEVSAKIPNKEEAYKMPEIFSSRRQGGLGNIGFSR